MTTIPVWQLAAAYPVEEARFHPLVITAEDETSWRISFDASDPFFKALDAILDEAEIDPDGYGWEEVILGYLNEHAPELADVVDSGETDEENFIARLGSESESQRFTELVWQLLHDEIALQAYLDEAG
jgi:hypothetical protein